MQERRLAAIMFTDIVGYTALMGSDEERAFQLLKENRLVQKPIIEKHGGKWLKEMGDGILASFTTVSDAVYCAKEIQEACLSEEDLKLRIGIHLGEVVFEDEDVFGDGVNIASRLEAIAPAGGIYISESVHKNVLNKKGIETEFVKEHHLKNVKESVRVYRIKVDEEIENLQPQKIKKFRSIIPYLIGIGVVIVALVALIFWYNPEEQSLVTESSEIEKSIAVIPFWNDSPHPDNAYFCSGMEEEIRIQLLKIADLQIESRQSVERYRQNPEKELTTIGTELGVAFIVEGSVRKIGDDVRVTVQLINAKTGNHIWGETYDGDYTEKLLVFQANTAIQIAKSLNAVITPKETQKLEKATSSDIKAYDFYVKGYYETLNYWKTLDNKYLLTALDHYDRALAIDPEFLLAITGKGLAFVAYYEYDSAMFYADKAIALDPEFNRGYGLKGECYNFMGKSNLAIEYFLKAISLPPKDGSWLWYNVALGRSYSVQKNNIIKALPYLKKGLEMGDEDLQAVYTIIAHTFLNIGDYKKGEEYILKVNELDFSCAQLNAYAYSLKVQSNYKKALHVLDSICSEPVCEQSCSRDKFYIYLELQEFELAEQEFNEYRQYVEERGRTYLFDSAYFAYMYKGLGMEQEALTTLNSYRNSLESQLVKNKNWVSYVNLSFVYAMQEEKEQALHYLSQAAELGFIDDYLEIHPIFENLWSDPKFKAIVKKSQDEKAAIRAQIREMEESGELDL